MLTTIVIILYIAVILFDFLPTQKEWAVKERIIYWFLLAVSFCVLVLTSLGIHLSGPSEPIRSLIEWAIPMTR